MFTQDIAVPSISSSSPVGYYNTVIFATVKTVFYLLYAHSLYPLGYCFQGGIEAPSKTLELWFSEELEGCVIVYAAFWTKCNSYENKYCSMLSHLVDILVCGGVNVGDSLYCPPYVTHTFTDALQ